MDQQFERMIEDCSKTRGTKCIRMQLIFNVIVGILLVIICVSLGFKFHKIDEQLEESQVPIHAVGKLKAVNPTVASCSDLKCIIGLTGPNVTRGEKGIPGAKGTPGASCMKGEPGDADIGNVDILTSCDALKKAGSSFNGIYLIDPDGPSKGLDPFSVVCDMTSDLTVGYTIIHHDKEEDGRVKGYERTGSFRADVTYNLNSAQIEAIKKVSTTCRQFIKYACVHSHFNNGGARYAYWVSVDGQRMYNWGKVPTGTVGCECWMTRTCDDKMKRCNCDVNDNSPRSDEGYLTDKATLPVTRLHFGDTGDNSERGTYTLGPLQCA